MCFSCDYGEFVDLVCEKFGYSVVFGNYLTKVEQDGLISLLMRERLGVLSKPEKEILGRHILQKKVVRL